MNEEAGMTNTHDNSNGVCVLCGYKYIPKTKQMYNHMKEKHPNYKFNYNLVNNKKSCGFCGEPIKSYRELINHIQKQHGDKIDLVSEIQDEQKKVNQIENSSERQYSDPYFAENVCNIVLRECVNNNKLIITGSEFFEMCRAKGFNTDQVQIGRILANRGVACTRKRYDGKRERVYDLSPFSNREKAANMENIDNSGMWICPLCGNKVHPHAIGAHMVDNHPNYKFNLDSPGGGKSCGYCGKKISKYADLIEHILIEHMELAYPEVKGMENWGEDYNGSYLVREGGLKGTTDTDYFYFLCPYCKDGHIMRVLSMQTVHWKHTSNQYNKDFEVKANCEFTLGFKLYCEKCGHSDAVKISNVGLQVGYLEIKNHNQDIHGLKVIEALVDKNKTIENEKVGLKSKIGELESEVDQLKSEKRYWEKLSLNQHQEEARLQKALTEAMQITGMGN